MEDDKETYETWAEAEWARNALTAVLLVPAGEEAVAETMVVAVDDCYYRVPATWAVEDLEHALGVVFVLTWASMRAPQRTPLASLTPPWARRFQSLSVPLRLYENRAPHMTWTWVHVAWPAQRSARFSIALETLDSETQLFVKKVDVAQSEGRVTQLREGNGNDEVSWKDDRTFILVDDDVFDTPTGWLVHNLEAALGTDLDGPSECSITNMFGQLFARERQFVRAPPLTEYEASIVRRTGLSARVVRGKHYSVDPCMPCAK